MNKTKHLFGALSLGVVCAMAALPAQAAQATKVDALTPGVTMNQLTNRAPVHWVSVEQIAASLKGKPAMSVGFDVDDTLLYSSPGFFYGKQKYSPKDWSFLKKQKFWDDVSCGWDKFSVPKKSAAALVKMHLARGDKLYFITARPAPKSCKEQVTQIIGHDFGIAKKDLNKVIFTGPKHGSKVKYIKRNNVKIFYGDADGDILDARAAGAEGIRVMRPLNSTNHPMPRNGSFGEKVVINSQY